jgi:dCMP deaminase
MKDAEKIERAAAAIDAALEGLDNGEVYYALTRATRVPPGRGIFEQHRREPEAFEDGRMLETAVGIPRIPRLPWDAFFMLHAHLAATRSTCDRGPELLLDPGRRGVGAVLVRERRIIAGGYNGSPPGAPHCNEFECPECEWEGPSGESQNTGKAEDGSPVCPECRALLRGGHLLRDGHCVRTIHAEANALLQCALDGTSPRGGTVYTTASPCWDCSKMLARAGVERLVYGAEYGSRYGLSKDACGLLRAAGVRVEHLDVREALR